ncbi:unnamed protein product [Amoebophrya sp. A25]|nr:unnamed protein product [Amoebophrya sp. A25]|eukprot:GSA25T00025844001.1
MSQQFAALTAQATAQAQAVLQRVNFLTDPVILQASMAMEPVFRQYTMVKDQLNARVLQPATGILMPYAQPVAQQLNGSALGTTVGITVSADTLVLLLVLFLAGILLGIGLGALIAMVQKLYEDRCFTFYRDIKSYEKNKSQSDETSPKGTGLRDVKPNVNGAGKKLEPLNKNKSIVVNEPRKKEDLMVNEDLVNKNSEEAVGGSKDEAEKDDDRDTGIDGRDTIRPVGAVLDGTTELSSPTTSSKVKAERTLIIADNKSVTLCNDEHFSRVRERCGLRNDFLKNEFEFTPDFFEPHGGKGGELMCFTRSRKFIVKQMSPGDHQTLLEIAKQYVDHVLGGQTLLTLMPLHFTYEKRPYLVMINCLAKSYSAKATASPRDSWDLENLLSSENGGYDFLYDLKGCDDDKLMMRAGKKIAAVRKRIWHIWMWGGKCFWSDKRREYYQEKVAARAWKLDNVPENVRGVVTAAIRRDCEEFLMPLGLMDYSLIVAGKKLSKADQLPSSAVMNDITLNKIPTSPQNWRCPILVTPKKITGTGGSQMNKGQADGKNKQDGKNKTTASAAPSTPPSRDTFQPDEVLVLSIGIIDFLQRWTAIKRVAQCVKVMERDKATIPPEAYGRRFADRMCKKFLS